jgi:hypothetical protein
VKTRLLVQIEFEPDERFVVDITRAWSEYRRTVKVSSLVWNVGNPTVLLDGFTAAGNRAERERLPLADLPEEIQQHLIQTAATAKAFDQ